MFLEQLWSHLDLTWLLTALVGLLTFLLVRHWLVVRSLPPGPFPLPLVGNLLSISMDSSSMNLTMMEWSRKYGSVYTMWMGPVPTIMCSGWETCKDALVTRKNDFSGRIKRHSGDLILGDGSDVIFSDFGPCWETLRKILALAVRKYSVSEKLAAVAVDVVDEVVDLMVAENGPVDANDYTYLALYSVLASSTFGRSYGPQDPEFLALRSSNDRMNDCFERDAMKFDALPILRFVYRQQHSKLKEACEDFRGHFVKHYKEHQETYTKGVVRDFTDAVIAARDEAQEESRDSVQYLTGQNIVSLMLDLFSAGTETTRLTINWLLLYACSYPEIQQRMQKEIDLNIGSRDPVQSDRDSCPYIQAAITEILRLRPIIDFTLEHKAICDTEIGGHKIRQGTSILFNIASCHKDPSTWPDPEEFKPERFLDAEGRFNNARLAGYMPFGLGRRACPGEKLGLIDVFLILVRLLQKCAFQLEDGPGTVDLQPKLIAFANHTHPYKVVVRRRNQV